MTQNSTQNPLFELGPHHVVLPTAVYHEMAKVYYQHRDDPIEEEPDVEPVLEDEEFEKLREQAEQVGIHEWNGMEPMGVAASEEDIRSSEEEG